MNRAHSAHIFWLVALAWMILVNRQGESAQADNFNGPFKEQGGADNLMDGRRLDCKWVQFKHKVNL